MDSYHVLQFDDTDAGHLRHYRQRQKLDYMFEVLLEFRERLLEKYDQILSMFYACQMHT